MEKKYLAGILIAVLAVVFIALIYSVKINTPECNKDSDCKLIYSSCDCEAVSAYDARDFWNEGTGVICKINGCASKNTTSVCYKNKCTRNDLFASAST